MSMEYDLVSSPLADPPPKVSVWMITYNHEDYIAQALDSILTQQTRFPFEIVVGEDCSPDSTRQVLMGYQRRHPGVIRLLLWRENVGMMLNCKRTLEACRGEYIALCEGDDYWTDPSKLQRQVDMLDSHPEMALCHHEVDYVTYEKGQRKCLETFPPESMRGTREAVHLIDGNFIQTCSKMIRRACLPTLDEDFEKLKLGDWPLSYLVAESGSIGYIDRNMADYRVHVNNQWKDKSREFRYIESARMCFYLAVRARCKDAQVGWRESGIRMLEHIFGGQLKLTAAFRMFRHLSKQEFIGILVASALLGRYFKQKAIFFRRSLRRG